MANWLSVENIDGRGVFYKTLRALSVLTVFKCFNEDSSSFRLLESSVLILAISFVNVNSFLEFMIKRGIGKPNFICEVLKWPNAPK